MTLEQLAPYYQGVFFATVALKSRFAESGSEGRKASTDFSTYERLTSEYTDAVVKETRELKRG